jgi:glycosyltransferase involved in cell wall biosynthesis
MSGFEENEISEKAFGGTELAKRKLANLIDPELLNQFQIICSRPRELEMDKIRIFWSHDLPEDPECKKFQEDSFKENFHKFVYISNWQYSRFQLIHGFPYDSKSIVLEHGIDPASTNVFESKPKDKIRLVYTSTPQRGLEILVPVFKKLAETNPDIHLDVFSSFKIYGWEDSDTIFQPLYDEISNHPQMTYHGFVPNDELQKHLTTAHIFAYPSIWMETACRAMIEAMSAGLLCVHPNFGALSETSGGLNIMYQGDYLNKVNHANIFAQHLSAAIDIVRKNEHEQMVSFNKTYVDSRFNIERVKAQWTNMLNNLLKQYPTIESRGKPKKQFVYRTN